MEDTDSALTLFAVAVDAKTGQLGSRRVALLKALAARRITPLNPFRPKTGFRDDLQSCFAAQAFVTLAAIAHIGSAQSEFERLVKDTWDGSIEELVAVGEVAP